MEQITSFVLGITAGGLIIVLISLAAAVLKIKKEVAEMQKKNDQNDRDIKKIHNTFSRKLEESHQSIGETREGIMDEIREISGQIQETIETIREHMDREKERQDSQLKKELESLLKIIINKDESLNQRIEDSTILRYKDYNDLKGKIDEITRYVDSRIDKSIDSLCLRMDTMFIQKETDTTNLKS